MKNKFPSLRTKLLILFIVLQIAVPAVVFYPERVSAQGVVSDPTHTGVSVGNEVKNLAVKESDKAENKAWEALKKGLILSATLTLRNTLVTLARNAASQSYEFVTTGNWGEGPMFYDQAWGQFKQDIMDYTVGQFLTNLQGALWDELGFDICNPGTEMIKLNIAIGLQNKDAIRKTPDCQWTNLSKNWLSFMDNIKTMADQFKDQPFAASILTLQKVTEVSFSSKSSDIGIALTLEDELTKQQQKTMDAEEKQRTENLGSTAITTLTGTTIKTPAFLTRGHIMNEEEAMSSAPKDEAKASQNVMADIPESIAGAFLSTFVSKGFTDLMTRKFFQTGLVQNSTTYQPADNLFDQKKQVAQDVQKIKTVNFNYSTKQIDLMTEFTSCPTPRQINNCVMDGNFAEAVRQAAQGRPLTVAEAIEQGKIDGSLILINQNDTRNSSDDCYQIGFCYSNLVKLRKARILPIGWEIATGKVTSGEKISLNYVISQFNVSGSKFEKLIDPNWILKYPLTQCKAMVYGPLQTAPGTASRAEICVDMPSCVQTDDKGKCLSWGYCAAEKNIFRLGGEQCNGAYDSCRTMESRQGKTVNYVLNTVDRTGCDQGSVGCKWYATTMKKGQSGFVWDTLGEKILLNKNIEDQGCKPADEGCTRLVRTLPGIGTNLVPNGDFEIYPVLATGEPVPNTIPGWSTVVGNQNQVSIVTANVAAGKGALTTSSALVNFPTIQIVPKNYVRYFAVSAEVKATTAPAAASPIALGVVVAPGNPYSAQITPVTNAVKTLTTANEWRTVYNIYQVSPQVGVAVANQVSNLQFTLSVPSGGPVFLDNVMVEELEAPDLASMSQFNAYATPNSTLDTYLKKAPDYMKCYDVNTVPAGVVDGRPNSDAEINKANDAVKTQTVKGCSDFAQLCTAPEVGCNEYKPTDGGMTAMGVASYADYCPQQCAGYQTFSQGSTYFENAVFPLYLIPSTAKTCSASVVGCDEFTNLDVLAAGGESKEYYSELRQCEKLPENQPACESYYTWVGDKTKGYQLQAYNLKMSAVNAAGTSFPDGPATILSSADSEAVCDATVFAAKSNPDCLEFYDKAGNVSYRLLSKVITCSENCHPYRRTIKYVSVGTDPTKSAKAQCEARLGTWQANVANSLTDGECIFMAIPGEGRKCSAPAAGCREYRGNFAGDERVIYENTFSTGDWSELQSASARVVTMADGQYLNASVSGGSAPYVYTKKESVNLTMPGEYNLTFWIKDGLVADGFFSAFIKDTTNTGNVLVTLGTNKATTKDNWSFYSFDFNVDDSFSSGNYVIGIEGTGGTSQIYLDNFKIVKVEDKKYLIKDSWSTPIACDNTLANSAALTAELPQAQLGCREYTDPDRTTHYLKSFSSLCDADKVGCEALIDTKNSATPFVGEYKGVDVKTFTIEQACGKWSEEYITFAETSSGGELRATDQNPTEIRSQDVANECVVNLINTQTRILNKVTQSFGGACIDSLHETWDNATHTCNPKVLATVPVDSLIYLVNNKEKQCKNTEKGCKALGLPNLTVDVAGNYVVPADKGWNTMFYKVDPDKFEGMNSPLCKESEVGCEEYKDDKDAALFFKDPGKKVCEYRKPSGALGYGWYRKKAKSDDPDVECAQTSFYNDGVNQLYRTTEAQYSGWAGLCKENQNTCTSFVDSSDKSLSIRGKAYYYLNDENIDKASCSTIGRKDGCILFNDTSMVNENGNQDLNLKWSTVNSYLASDKVGGALVSPVPGGTLKTLLQTYNKLEAVMALDVCSTGDCSAFETLVRDYMSKNDPLWETTFRGDVNPQNCSSKQVNCTRKKLLEELDNSDSNTIIKVVRDRECANWYACKVSHWAWDDTKNKYIEVCDNIGVCDQLNAMEDSAACSHFVEARSESTNLLAQNKRLEDVYASRPVVWFNFEYSGMSIPQFAPAQFYNVINLNPGAGSAQGDYRLVNQLLTVPCQVDVDCHGANKCSTANPTVENCRCVNNVCVQPAGGDTFDEAQKQECRAYPQEEAPFPASVAGMPAYSKANTTWIPTEPVATRDLLKDKDLGCFYSQVNFGGGTIKKYLPNYSKYPIAFSGEGFCQDEPDVECSCNDFAEDNIAGLININTKTMCSSAKCGLIDKVGKLTTGMCMKKSAQVTDYRGWEGYCLEKDQSLTVNNKLDEHPCLTWYPTESLGGLQDLQNQYDTAGFWPAQPTAALGYADGPFYCVETSRWEERSKYLNTQGGLTSVCGGTWQCSDHNRQNCLLGEEFTNGKKCTMADFTGGQGCFINDSTKPVTKKTATEIWNAGPAKCGEQGCDGHVTFSGSGHGPGCLYGNSINDYKPGGAYYMENWLNDQGCNLDSLRMSFQCIPTNLPAAQSSAWYPDPNGQSTQGGGLNEVQKLNCEAAIRVATESGENRAYTNRIYKKLQSEPQACGLFGAVPAKDSIDTGVVKNLFIGDQCVLNGGYRDGGVVNDFESNDYENIKKLFAKSFGYYQIYSPLVEKQPLPSISSDFKWPGTTGVYKNVNTHGFDITPIGDQTHVPIGSVIAATDPAGKADNKGNILYSAIPNKLNINGQVGGDVVGTNGQVEVTLKFYAWADDEQMPLRSVVINWGNGVTTPQSLAKYQNHKPRCQREASELLGLCGGIGGYACADDTDCVAGVTCNVAPNVKADRFGDTQSACMESYFQYNTLYQCTAENLSRACVDNKDTNCKTRYLDKDACQFVPKVVATDNWGWCNGNCPGRNNGCYYIGVDGGADCDAARPWAINQGPGATFSGRIIVMP